MNPDLEQRFVERLRVERPDLFDGGEPRIACVPNCVAVINSLGRRYGGESFDVEAPGVSLAAMRPLDAPVRRIFSLDRLDANRPFMMQIDAGWGDEVAQRWRVFAEQDWAIEPLLDALEFRSGFELAIASERDGIAVRSAASRELMRPSPAESLPEAIAFSWITLPAEHDHASKLAAFDEAFGRAEAAFEALLTEKSGEPPKFTPAGGRLARLDADDYKRLVRPRLLERGDDAMLGAADELVLETMRRMTFRRLLDEAGAGDVHARRVALDRAGRVLIASDFARTHDARLGSDAADVIVDLIRASEPQGLYGATAVENGDVPLVAVLHEKTPAAAEAIGRVSELFTRRTGQAATIVRNQSA